MLDTYFPVLVLLILAAGFAITMIILSISVGPKRPTEMKEDPFECGTVATGDVSGRHSVKFYLVAMTFIVFDVEIVFLYPWAINVKDLGWLGFFAAAPFLLILIIGLLYEWKRGVLDVA